MEHKAFLNVKAKLQISSFVNRRNFGSGKVHFNLTGTYMNDPENPPGNPSFGGSIGSQTAHSLEGWSLSLFLSRSRLLSRRSFLTLL